MAWILILSAPHLHAGQTFTMSFWEDPETSLEFKYAELAWREIFGRLGIRFRYEVHPAKRSSILANSGKVDGEPARIGDYNTRYINLVRVEEPVDIYTVAAYVARPDLRITQWQDLLDSNLRLEYFRGIFIAEKRLRPIAGQERLTTATQPDEGLRKLSLGRIDVYIDIHERILNWLEMPEFRDAGIRLAGKLEININYPYVHKRHALLAPKLARIIKEMRTNGEFLTIWNQARKIHGDKVNQ